MHVAALDTCVLWPSLQRDFLLSLAVTNVFRPVWSDVVLEELQRHEAIKLVRRQGLTAIEAGDRAARLIGKMRAAFDGATIDGWEQVKAVGLPDPDDEHVLGAAVVGGAQVIVTENHKQFPTALLPEPLHTQGLRRSSTRWSSLSRPRLRSSSRDGGAACRAGTVAQRHRRSARGSVRHT